jgi:hypothetical protein
MKIYFIPTNINVSFNSAAFLAVNCLTTILLSQKA